jgi:DNA-binding transcriptional LysR family regulator
MSLDLNDLFYFAHVVDNGGFAAAARSLKAPKSKLSRRIANLEKHLGVRLLERTTRRFRVTEVGQSFYLRCKRVLEEADLAEATTLATTSEPRGLVRVSCPTGFLEQVRPFVPSFLARHPLVNLHLVVTNRPVNLIDERIDVAVRVRHSLDTDAELSVRTLGTSRIFLVAAPSLAAQIPEGASLDRLASLPLVGTSDPASVEWHVEGPGGERRVIRQAPRLACSDFVAVREAAVAGLGVAQLPDHTCAPELARGGLVRVFPGWEGASGIVHLVFTSRRGLPPAVRAWIDHLASSWVERHRGATGHR